jgi:L-malate glycosyltransferase
MKICFVADGKEDHTRFIVNYFAQEHEVHLISYRFNKGYNSRVILHLLKPPIYLPEKMKDYLLFLYGTYQTKRLIAVIQPEIIDAHFITVFGFLATSSRFHPLIVTAWGSDLLVHPKKNLIWRLLAKHTLQKADYLICLFDQTMLQDQVGKWIPHNLEMASIPRGINTELFKNRDRISLRQKYGLKADDIVVINIRGGEPIYDPVTFLKSVPFVIKEFPQTKFFALYQQHQETFKKIIAKLGIEKNIVMLNWMPNEKIVDYLSISDIYVSTSLSDGASNALFEGMACELAPVVTDIAANRFWIEDEKNGFLFKPKDYAHLAELIVRLIKDKNRREEFGTKCRAIVVEKAEFKTQMGKIEIIYQDLLSKHLGKPFN